MTLLRTIIAFGIAFSLLLCVSWQETRVRHERRRLQEFRVLLESRTAESELLNAQVARLQSPQRILRVSQSLNMGLQSPGNIPHFFYWRIKSARGTETQDRDLLTQESENEDAFR